MGEANKRGSYDKRKQAAIERQAKINAAIAEVANRRGKSRLPIMLAAALALAS